ncbi:hypothetical protein ABAC460_05905 [Asticcacaulis sp. AC460]|uniref:hypothetical protein n=1 Tax=Asticcacaulis sp. AC460 TaxID=1282360 RepID=UPI0003C3ED4F|nr:hypothetical protein [Asticcacaulis sp. AC460]ESQ91516.1 hypothetical protein ABAC460_05905 [Asticcacaulis sp. AC460]
MMSASQTWTDQVDFRPAPYAPDPLRHLMKASLITGGISLALGFFIIGGKLASLPDIDPMADPGLVVDYAAQPPADRGLLAVNPDMPADARYALASMPAPAVRVRQVKAEVYIPDMPEMPAYTAGDIAAPEVVAVAMPEPVKVESGPRPYYSLARGD